MIGVSATLQARSCKHETKKSFGHALCDLCAKRSFVQAQIHGGHHHPTTTQNTVADTAEDSPLDGSIAYSTHMLQVWYIYLHLGDV